MTTAFAEVGASWLCETIHIKGFESLTHLPLLLLTVFNSFRSNNTHSEHIQDAHSYRPSRCLSWPGLSSNILQGLFHPVRFNRHLGLWQLQRCYHRMRFLHLCTFFPSLFPFQPVLTKPSTSPATQQQSLKTNSASATAQAPAPPAEPAGN